jgi:hypothetical protein
MNIERCWICEKRLFRGEPTRLMPGTGLSVHTRCYEAESGPAPRAARQPAPIAA